MGILDQLSQGQIGGANGSTASVTVPFGCQVVGASASSTAGGTIVITPHGGNQTATAKTITLPAGTAWTLPILAGLGQMGTGTTFTFSGIDAYDIWWVKTQTGA
jgi:hypothetical protein